MIVTGNCNTPDAENLLIIDVDVMRDLFAAFALVGFIESDFARTVSRPDAASADCYRLADAMLAQRAQGKEQS